MEIFIGVIIGFLIGFFFLKHQIKKDGAGQLKVCQSCPYFNRSIDTAVTESEDKND